MRSVLIAGSAAAAVLALVASGEVAEAQGAKAHPDRGIVSRISQAAAGRSMPMEFNVPVIPGEFDAALFSAAVGEFSNRARKAKGLRPLGVSDELSEVARIHALNMAKFAMPEHAVPAHGQNTLIDRLRGQGIGSGDAGELIARDSVYDLSRYEIVSPDKAIADTGRDRVILAGSRAEAEPGDRGRRGDRRIIPANLAGRCVFFHVGSMEVVPARTYGEVARDVVRNWMDSGSERAELLSPGFARQGAAFAILPGDGACGEIYVVQTLAN